LNRWIVEPERNTPVKPSTMERFIIQRFNCSMIHGFL
jgi:hypothetical protein